MILIGSLLTDITTGGSKANEYLNRLDENFNKYMNSDTMATGCFKNYSHLKTKKKGRNLKEWRKKYLSRYPQ